MNAQNKEEIQRKEVAKKNAKKGGQGKQPGGAGRGNGKQAGANGIKRGGRK